MRESPIERHLCKLVSKAGGRAYKWVSPGNKGVPDRLVFLHGVIFLVELKATNGKLSTMQKIQHKVLEALGHHVAVLSSKEQVSEWVEMQSNALKPIKDDYANISSLENHEDKRTHEEIMADQQAQRDGWYDAFTKQMYNC